VLLKNKYGLQVVFLGVCDSQVEQVSHSFTWSNRLSTDHSVAEAVVYLTIFNTTITSGQLALYLLQPNPLAFLSDITTLLSLVGTTNLSMTYDAANSGCC
jgi:hypothetical protein